MGVDVTETTGRASEQPWHTDRRAVALTLVYGVLTLFGIVLTTDAISDATPFPLTSSGTQGIPPFVFLYAFLGAMAYAFTSVVLDDEKTFSDVLKVGLRVFAALPLAAGVFLLAAIADVPTGSPAVVAGVAFLVGLYVNLALKLLGGVADRILGGGRRPAATPSAATPTDESTAETATTDREEDTTTVPVR